MIKITNIQTYGWEAAIRGMRNPMNSWGKSDSQFSGLGCDDVTDIYGRTIGLGELEHHPDIGPNDLSLMLKLAKAGADHAKYRRMIAVTMDILAPLYWWKEFDTYKVGTVANSCSTMHKIAERQFSVHDFSVEHLSGPVFSELSCTVRTLNRYRDLYNNWDEYDNNTKNALLVGIHDGVEYDRKDAWWQLIQLLPTSYNQLRTVQLNYEVLANIYRSRREHKLDEWQAFCAEIEKLPYSEIITLMEE